MRNLSALAHALMPTLERAGVAIMQIYDAGFTVQRKDDNSPLTLADLESQRIILEDLSCLTPDVPILSEESAQAPWAERQRWHELWVVDPLDGTREFVKRNREFTINIALVVNHEPLLGLIAAPAQGLVYWGAGGHVTRLDGHRLRYNCRESVINGDFLAFSHASLLPTS